MHAEARHQRILEIITENGRAHVDALSADLGVSSTTVRRDLAALEADGALRRVYRGATRSRSGSYEPPFPVRAKLNVEAKAQIAEAISGLVEDGQTLILDAGTTGVAIAERLVDRAVTVCTPSLRVVRALLPSASVRLMVTGGVVRPIEQSLVGPGAVSMFDDHRFDLFLLTVSGLHPEHGMTEWNPEDAAVKRAALRAAGRCIAACDSSKIGHTAFARICDLSHVELLVTDAGVDPEQRESLEALGLKVLVASN